MRQSELDKDMVAVHNRQSSDGKDQALQQPVSLLKGVGVERAKMLAKLGILTLEDLLFHFPLRYEDRLRIIPIGETVPGQQGTFKGEITSVHELRPRRNLTILKALIRDQSGQAYAVWFNQAFLKRALKPGINILITGRVEQKYLQKEIQVTDYEKSEQDHDNIHSGRIVPIYPLTGKLSQRFLRQLIYSSLEQFEEYIPDSLPQFIKTKYKFPSVAGSLKGLHFPEDLKQTELFRKRLAYEELLLVQLRLLGEKALYRQQSGIAHLKTGELTKKYVQGLSFKLTNSQKSVITEIFKDMEQDFQMARLLQGDVGSGKTVVAILAVLKALDNGYQAALMAPTEILAEQHYLNIKQDLKHLGVKVGILTGGLNSKTKEKLRQAMQTGELQIVIGTHALIQEDIKFCNLGLVVIDEQHRFGVAQRARLQAKGVSNPDLLVMTATPIPRTLALTLYGDLDLSVINELPPGRQPVITKYVSDNKRTGVYDFIKEQLDQGRQAYVVCPLVADSEKIEAEAASQLAESLQKEEFQAYQLGLLHGKMSSREKEEAMLRFRDKETDVLVATSVIEVGVDIANASVMLINGCERFGLAQLHQLRGRIGRGNFQSYCVLMGRPRSQESKTRIKAMVNTDNGFLLAEEDLKLRGPGEFFGSRQHGLPEFKAANLLKDYKLLELARKDALEIAEHIEQADNYQIIQKAIQKYQHFHP